MDGLRATAVLGVLAYHLNSRWLPGGFLGVDLFFVLSGFLITTLLADEWAARGRIDLAAFWLRRVRRLLPLALVVVVVVMAVGAWTLDSSELGSLRQDGLWTIFYGANWHLIGSGQSYFAAFAVPSPLRHAWSLAIEEQFYLLWPLLVLAGLRWGRSRFLGIAIAVLAVTSAVLMAVFYSPEDPSRAYYGTDTRAFELLIGAGGAVLFRSRPNWFSAHPNWLRRNLVVPALVVAAAIALVHDQWVGYYRGGAVVFSIAAVVLIAGAVANPGARVARVLAARPLVAIGRVSYGVYLWHWPVYSWLDHAWAPTSGWSETGQVAAKLALTAALSVTSYYLIERPIRRGRIRRFRLTGPRMALLAPAAIALVAVIAVVSTLNATAPLDQTEDATALSTPRTWVANSASTTLRLATVGDSVTRSLAPGLAEAAKSEGWSYTDASVSSCSVAGTLMIETNGEPWPTGADCPQAVSTIQQKLLSDDSPDVILVHSRWETYAVQGSDGETLAVNTPEHKAYIASQLRATMARLTSGGAKLVWIDTVPMTVDLCRRLGHTTSVCAHTASDATVDAYTALRKQVAAEFAGKVVSISLTDLLCTGTLCPQTVNGQDLRPDGLHFSTDSAISVAPEILRRATTALGLQ